jgi:hypothetical protein
MKSTNAVEVKIQAVLAPFISCADANDGIRNSAIVANILIFSVLLIIFE